MVEKILIDVPEIVKTQRITLQMPKAGFGKKLYSAMSDGFDDCVKWLNWPQIMPAAQSLEEECRRHHAEFILRDTLRYLIICNETQDVLGRCAFPSFGANWEVPQFGISYFIRKSVRSKGYATESAHAMSIIGFSVLKARKLQIHCDSDNLASIKIPKKLGFKLEYIQKGGWPRQDGRLADLHTYSIFSENDLSSKLEVFM